MSQFWKGWWHLWIWSKYGLWFHLFSGCYEKNQAVNLRLLFYEVCWLSRGKMLRVFLQQRMRSPQDPETMPVKTILTLRDLLKCGISVIGSLTRRVWIDPLSVKLAWYFVWRLRYRDYLKSNWFKLLDLQDLNSFPLLANYLYVWKKATDDVLLDVMGWYVK